jgi:hypothetical protein
MKRIIESVSLERKSYHSDADLDGHGPAISSLTQQIENLAPERPTRGSAMRAELLVRVVRDGLGVRVRRVLVRGCGVLVGLHRMFSGGLVVAVGVVLCRFMVRFGGMLVVLCCFLVCVVCHDSLFFDTTSAIPFDDATPLPSRLAFYNRREIE